MPVAVITGGSRGFGRALAIDLAKDGWSLVLDGRDRGLCRRSPAASATSAPRRPSSPATWPPRPPGSSSPPPGEFGSLDLLVNNASTLGPSPLPRLEHYPLADLRDVYEVNVVAPLALVQEALPDLRRVRGTVVSLSSDAAVEGYEGWGGYGSSKAALDHLHRTLAAEEPDAAGLRVRPGRHAHGHAPGGVPGRGHLRPTRAGVGGAGAAGPAGLGRPERPVPGRGVGASS